MMKLRCFRVIFRAEASLSLQVLRMNEFFANNPLKFEMSNVCLLGTVTPPVGPRMLATSSGFLSSRFCVRAALIFFIPIFLAVDI
jgi:hypothetical protein